ncbi:tryptophan ABC transporter substrate-binding protein [Granulicatella sp. zg-84]|uniref:tryptophan ABC transporter substrate-binding protein n=1 Tax=Granulicatella sp. zg-84 TaxID=2678503 RepID=UPI001F0810C2|nr:tryptophan ABC transporter substrate-binding protein [Granulicatella sp. zg-84]
MMKKTVLAFGLFILAVLGIGYVTQQKPAQQPVQETKKIVKVGVLQLLSHPALDAIYKGITDELGNLGYVDGKTMQIDFQNAQADQSNLVSMSQKLVSEKPDILIGITTPATASLANATKEIPIIMGGITYPVQAGLIASEEKPGNNITGVSDRTPIKQQLELMKKVVPNLKKIGILYTASEDNSTRQVEEAKELAKALDLEVVVKSISNTNDIEQVTEGLASDVQAIFVPIDNTVASAMATVVKVTDKYKVPVFPSADTMVKDGGVLGIGVDQYKIGVETAKVVVAVLNGVEPKEKAIVLANEGVVYINETKAKALGIDIPEEIKAKAIIVDKE